VFVSLENKKQVLQLIPTVPSELIAALKEGAVREAGMHEWDK